MGEHRDAPATDGTWSDGVAAARASRPELATRFRQAHLESRDDAADPLLEVPQAHAVRTRSMRALRIRVRREHGRRVRERSQIAALRDVDAEAVIRATEAHAPRDRGGSPPRQRGTTSVRGRPREKELSVRLYQCPTCGRFVSEQSTECVCGVRFAPMSAVTFSCPECGSRVPSDVGACPVCARGFGPSGGANDYVYACPRCGVHVTSEAVRCFCGAWFED